LGASEANTVPGGSDRTSASHKSAARPAVGGLPRYAHANIEIDGVTIKAGELVQLGLHEANVDSAAFERPDEFDIRRSENPHLTFGHG
jgi:cytochrome P450